MMADYISFFKKHKPALYSRLCQVASQRQAGLEVVLESVDKPNNLGAIIRSCDGLGVQSVSYLPTQQHMRAGKLLVRSSVSASDWVDLVQFDDVCAHFAQLKAKGFTIIASSPDPSGVSLYKLDFKAYDKIALVVGSEGRGLSTTALEAAHKTLYIPMCGVVQSFNVSVATAIILAEIRRQREAPHFFLNTSQQEALVTAWAKKVLKRRHFSEEQIAQDRL